MSKVQGRRLCEFTGGVGCPKLEGTPIVTEASKKKEPAKKRAPTKKKKSK